MRVALIISLLCLGACSATPVDPDRMDQRVAALQQDQRTCPPGHPRVCAPDSPLADLYDGSGDSHHVITLQRGTDALAARLHLIRSARERILLQNYILYDDEAGQLLLAEMLAAARRGVEVHILVDALLSLPDPAVQAALEMAHPNFQVRLYNPLGGPRRELAVARGRHVITSALCCFRTLNHRMHNKLFAVDGRHMIVGGRNTAGRYFDLDTRMNFIDFEVLVTGQIVHEAEAGFFRYWDHDRVRSPRHTRDVAEALEGSPVLWPEIGSARIAPFIDLARDPDWLAELIEHFGHVVGEVSYFNDPPDKIRVAPQEPEEDSTGQLRALMASAQHSIHLQSPYWVMSRDFERFLREHRDPAVTWRISTNSLAATDAFPVYAISRRQRERMLRQHHLTIHELRPFPEDIADYVPRYDLLIEEKAAGIAMPMSGDPRSPVADSPGPRVSVHGKVLVIDREVAVITSHNFDPRSEVYNTENGLIIHDAAFAGVMADKLERLMADSNSWTHGLTPSRVPVLGAVNRGAARVSRRLPTLDLWPAHMSQNYSLVDGGRPVLPDDPDFLLHYEPEGEFPEVALRSRRVQAGVVSRFFGFLRPLM
ncbi:phospholipase D-like domain-containing protein [Isoalcanivorax indicus]|uniref:phospholipase D-like domain-containing protein n=1 Tax=Isoalcanivorax indicus TaxID=2202653 RepID=UPI000DB90670|nr:phospholipase D family protein [Isoalcanivorax indicus]